MTRGQVERLWTALYGDSPCARVCVGPALARRGPGSDGVTHYVELRCADVYGTRTRAYGLTDDAALAALWELVVLHARVRRDEIEAALAAGGA